MSKSMPTGQERIQHLKTLGFSPKVILDGGAYRGNWSRIMASVFPGAKLVIVEPNQHLQKHIQENTSHISPTPIIVNAALGDTAGKVMLNIWRDKESDTGASILPHVAGDANQVIETDLITLDGIAEKFSISPDFVKLDLQGAELTALKGAENVLKHAEMMMIEFGCLEAYIGRTTPKELLEIMYDNNYCLYDIVDLHYRPYDGSLVGGDFFFVKNTSQLKDYKGWS